MPQPGGRSMFELARLVDPTNATFSARFDEELLDSLMHVGDPISDRAMATLKEAAYDPDGGQIDQLRALADSGEPSAMAFFERAEHRPPWFDIEMIERGQRVATSFLPAYGISLMHSLFAGALFPRASLVTGATGRLGANPARRIHETGAFISAILQPGGLDAGSVGFDTAVRVRLLHSSIRSWLGRSPGFTETFVGVPIDQTMLAMTNGLFSYLNVRSLARLGIALGDDDLAAHHHLWRYVGYLLGIDERLLPPTLEEEAELWSALVAHQAMPDVIGPRFIDVAGASIAALLAANTRGGGAKGSERGRKVATDLMLHLSGPAWFGVDDPAPSGAALLAVRGLGRTAHGAYRHVPRVASWMERRNRATMLDSIDTARSHGYGVEVEHAEDPNHAATMATIAARVQRHFEPATVQRRPPIATVRHARPPVSALDRIALNGARRVVAYPRVTQAILGRTPLGDWLEPAQPGNPYARHDFIREQGPVVWNSFFQQWFVSGYDEARQVLASPHVTVASQTELVLACHPHTKLSEPSRDLVRHFLLFTDPPQHTRLRRIVSGAFTPKQIERLEVVTDRLARQLVDELADGPVIDLFAAFNAPFPIEVISELIGIPRDRWAWSKELSDALTALLNPFPDFAPHRMDHLLRDAIIYFDELIDERRRNPTDDLLTALVAAESDDDRLDRFEVIAVAMFLMFAGHETTSGQLGTALIALADAPEQRAMLRDRPDLWPNAVEELLRFDTALQIDPRAATDDITIGDKTIKRGQNMVVMLGAANRDPRRYDEPDKLRVDREDPRPISFGHGIHHCLGAALARMELRTGLRHLLAHLGDYTIDPDTVVWKEHMILRGPVVLPVRRGADSS